MLNRFVNWYRHTIPGKKLAVSFASSWMIWFMASFLIRLFDDTARSRSYHLFWATGMAVFMTITGEWKKVKAVLKKKHNAEVHQ